MAVFDKGDWVFAPDEEEMYLPAKATKKFKAGEPGAIEYEDGDTRDLSVKETEGCVAMDEEALKPVDNLVKLNNLNEPVILHNLRMRYKKDAIYTHVSSILIAVNPFRLLPIYTPEVMDSYMEHTKANPPPHIFATADDAFNSMMSDNKNQSVVISGESGAGKTETMKLVLQYLAEKSSRLTKAKTEGQETEGLEQQILKANPVMEAFGNAKTLRNNNSSRFGKWTEINFNRAGGIVGGSIINYLLEKSRLVFQGEGERNYHIFYQLLAGAEAHPELKTSLELKEADEYHYLNQSGVTTVDGINDEKEYEDLNTAMDVLQMTPDEKDNVFRTVAGVMHLGNVEFEPDVKATAEDGSKVKNRDALELAAKQFGVEPDALDKCLCFRNMGTRSIIFVAYSVQQANDSRDAATKTVYGKLFDWLIMMINKSLGRNIHGDGSSESATVIGVLDIFGFESFETNSFEQLCINFCNEKLQFHFNEHIFRLEQEEYKAEGVPVDNISFKDNQPCLDLLEMKATGVFAMIDEEISVPKGSDDGFLSKVLAKHSKHDNLERPKPKVKDARNCFVVVHYAGPVAYNVTNFLEKNKDALHADIKAAFMSTRFDFIKALLTLGEEKAEEPAKPAGRGRARGGKKKQPTLGTQFKNQLQALMKTLNSTDPHFVRCMKPNHQKKGKIFEASMMLDQLRYAGLLEVCRIRQIGYPIRKPFADFLFRYKCLGLTAKSHTELCDMLVEKGLMIKGEFQYGHSKVFMRNQQQAMLDTAREEALKEVVVKMQTVARRFIQRCTYLRWMQVMKDLRAAVDSQDEEALDRELAMCGELPWRGVHLKVVKDAKALKERLEEERRVVQMLVDAIKERELNGLQSAVKTAEGLTPPLDKPEVAEAKALIERILEERKVLADLKGAIKARDKAQLTALLEKADELGLSDTDEARQAAALKQRIEEEEAAIEELKSAIEEKSLALLDPIIQRVGEMGLNPPELASAIALRDNLIAQLQAKKQIKEAIEARALQQIISALAKAKEVGVDDGADEVKAGKELQATIEAENAAIAELSAAADAADLGRIEKALARAAELKVTKNPAHAKAVTVKERLEAEQAALAALVAAVAAADAASLSAAVSRASELGMDCPELTAASSALAKLGAEAAALSDLNTAVAGGDIATLEAAIAKVEGMGMGGDSSVASARAALAKLGEEKAVAEALDAAAKGTDLPALLAAFAEGDKYNLAKRYGDVLERANAARKKLEEFKALEDKVTSAAKSGDLAALEEALKEADAAGLASAPIEEGRAAQGRLAEQREVTKELAAALAEDPQDNDKIGRHLSRARELGMDTAEMRQAAIIVERDTVIKEVKDALAEASKAGDLAALNEALERVIELGIEGEDIEAAKALQEKLEGEKELSASVVAAIKSAEIKAQSAAGVTAEDLEPLNKAMEEAAEKGLPDDSVAMVKGQQMKDRLAGIMELQPELAAAVDNAELGIRDLKKLLDRCDDLELKNELQLAVKDRLGELERERSEAMARGDEVEIDEDEAPSLDDEEAAKAREEKMAKAMQPKFHFTKFNGIREPDDFAKGVLLSKKKVKANQLRWQASTIHRSITVIHDRKMVKQAVRLHKSLLGYCGDKSMSFPATLAQDILQKGLENPELVDEIYVQICKHLTANPRPESVQRGWQVLCMAVGTFPPSRDFDNYLLNFILEKRDGSGAVGNYARYSLRRLEGILNSGPSGFVPSVEEIQAYKERPPILATVQLVDGTPLTEDLPITPDLNVSKVLDICNHFMELSDPRMAQFGIFVEDLDDEGNQAVATIRARDGAGSVDLPLTPRPLQDESFMGDVVTVKVRQHQAFKFVYKRKIFLRASDGESEDEMFNRLTYLQAADEVILGNIPVDEDTAAKMVAQAMAIDNGEELPDDADGLLECELMEYVPVPLREEHEPEEWAAMVLKHHADVVNESADDLQAAYVAEVSESPLYGTHFFHVSKEEFSEAPAKPMFPEQMSEFPDMLLVAFNSDGLHFLDGESRDVLASFGYADIYRWGGSSQQFSIIIWNADTQDTDDVSMHTTQAADMAALILDYIKAIMAASE